MSHLNAPIAFATDNIVVSKVPLESKQPIFSWNLTSQRRYSGIVDFWESGLPLLHWECITSVACLLLDRSAQGSKEVENKEKLRLLPLLRKSNESLPRLKTTAIFSVGEIWFAARQTRGQTRFVTCREKSVKWFDALCSGAAWCPVRVAMGVKAALPRIEIYIYNTVLCLAVLWSASWISEVSSCEYGRKLGGHEGHKKKEATC